MAKKVSYAILSKVYIITTMTAKVGYVCHHRSGKTPSGCISRVEKKKKKACVVVWVGVCLVQTQMYGKLHQRTSHLICWDMGLCQWHSELKNSVLDEIHFSYILWPKYDSSEILPQTLNVKLLFNCLSGETKKHLDLLYKHRVFSVSRLQLCFCRFVKIFQWLLQSQTCVTLWCHRTQTDITGAGQMQSQ